MDHFVDLEVFQGPFDLLLELIARRRLDVTEVDLAEITGDYLASLDGLDRVDLETATRFLVVAATLVELKAARLLPVDDIEDEHDLLAQARDLLYARLLEYRAFRDVAGALGDRMEVEGRHRARDVELEPRFRRLVPDAPLDLEVADLARIGARVTAPRPDPAVGLDHIRRTFLSIRDAAGLVLERLGTVGTTATFDELVAGRSRSEAVVVFLAALELYKLGHVDLAQDEHRGPLAVARREEAADLRVLTVTSAAESGADDDQDDDDLDGDAVDGDAVDGEGDQGHGGNGMVVRDLAGVAS